MSTVAGATTVNGCINGLGAAGGNDGGTNWDRGVRQVAQSAAAFDVVVIITDGNPTFYGNPGKGRAAAPGSARSRTASSPPTPSRPKGTRIVAFGVGDGVGSAARD